MHPKSQRHLRWFRAPTCPPQCHECSDDVCYCGCALQVSGLKVVGSSDQSVLIYLFIYLLFSHNKDYTSITLYKDVARGPRLVVALKLVGKVALVLCHKPRR